MSASRNNNKESVPLAHYKRIYRNLDPVLVSKRCNILYDDNRNCFTIRLMGKTHSVRFPEFSIEDGCGSLLGDSPTAILLIRYLIEGSYYEPTGRMLTYREIPAGEVYYPNFLGRCIKRLAFTFGRDLESFAVAMEKLGAKRMEMGDCSYRFEFISNLFMTFILWAGDDEFPPSAQILFDSGFPFAFTAEDIAVVGDVAISALKSLASRQD